MPYIELSRRQALEQHLISPSTSGDLNYLITQLLQEYLEIKGESYETYNSLIGVLSCASDELYRRKVIPYENKKIKQNGDVWL